MDQNNQDNSGVESEINGSAEAESNTNIQSRNIFDLSGVPNTETSIDLNQMRVDTIPDLSRFKDLKFLGLRQNLLASLNTNISLLINLTELELYDNQLTEIQGIENLINLEILDLSYNRIGKIKGLSTLSKLRKLFLINNKIEQIEGLEGLILLELLELGDNKIKEISNLNHLINLEELFLGKNKIKKIEGINSLVKLRVLSLPANRLTKLEGLENLMELEELHINDQGIESLNGIENQVNLQLLDAAANSISSLNNLGHLQKLTDIWLNNNKISSWFEVDKLSKLESLQTVYLEHNPIYNEGCANYRRKAILALPQIRQLDATFYESKENNNPNNEQQINKYAPRQPWGDYFIWLQENMQKFIDKYGKIDYLRHAINEWQNMPVKEKLIWTKKSEKDKRRYQSEIVEYYKFKYQNVEEQFE
uniref:HMG box domain-containing protein n=1 Tax=Meloidogyne incognita TaxID=6306 RepID=A0A914MZD2_MELIC